WALRYPSRGEKLSDASPSPREVSPCVYSLGRLFVAPVDHDRVLCVEADSGRKLWESPPLEKIVHLYGVAHERLIISTTDDLRAIDCATGRPIRDWLQPAG